MTAMRNAGRRIEVNDKEKSQQERMGMKLRSVVDGFNEIDFYARGRTM
jgi:hypothetical protein